MLNFDLHVISGLPRSGSTLLSALLAQNPLFHAAISTPVLGGVTTLRDTFNSGDRTALSLVSEDDQKNIYQSLINSYYQGRLDKGHQFVFDTNRLWSGKVGLLHALSAQSKMIVCVRNMVSILNSFESLFQENAFLFPHFFAGPDQWMTVYSRVDSMINRSGIVGAPWIALREGIYDPNAAKMLLIDYDLLVSNPQEVLKCIYQFLDQPFYEKHDVENVHLVKSEEDRIKKFNETLNAPKLHTINQQVKPIAKPMLLPPDLQKTLGDLNFWTDLSGSAAKSLTRS